MYYEKYLKYKEKYLELKNKLKISQTGGDMVRDVSLLRNINFFKCPDRTRLYTQEMLNGEYNPLQINDSCLLDDQTIYDLLSNHLCLVHGFIWNNTGLIQNYYKFYKALDTAILLNLFLEASDEDKPRFLIGKHTIKNFNEVGLEIKPTNDLMNLIENEDIANCCGFLVGLMFFKYFLPKEYKKYIDENYDRTHSGKNTQLKEVYINQDENTYDSKIFYIGIKSTYHPTIKSLIKYFQFDNIECFHLFLAYVWWICNDENGIIKYYIGLKESFQYIQAFIEYYQSGYTVQTNEFVSAAQRIYDHFAVETNRVVKELEIAQTELATAIKNKMLVDAKYNFSELVEEKRKVVSAQKKVDEAQKKVEITDNLVTRKKKAEDTAKTELTRAQAQAETNLMTKSISLKKQKVKLWSDDLYKSLKRLFNPENINVPSEYQKYEKEALKIKTVCNDWLESLAISYLVNISELPIYSYKSTSIYIDKTIFKFPDCGETSVRNLLNICFFNKKTQRFEVPNTAIDELKIFYETFTKFSDQSSSEKKVIFGKKLDSHEAWAEVVSNLNKKKSLELGIIKYLKSDGKGYEFEIDSGANEQNKSNIFYVISILLGIEYTDGIDGKVGVDALELFLEKIMGSFGCTLGDIDINDKFCGTIVFSKDDNDYKYHLYLLHYYIELVPKRINTSFKDVGETYEYLRNNIENIDDYNFMKIKYNPENLLKTLNKYTLNKINSYLLFNYFVRSYHDERHTCYVSLSRIHPVIHKHNLKLYGFKYDGDTLKEIKCLNPVEDDFPDGIDTLYIDVDRNINIDTIPDTIPDTVSTLIINSQTPNVTVTIPKNVQILKLKGISYKNVKIPTNITSLMLDYDTDLESELENIATNVRDLSLHVQNSRCDMDLLNRKLMNLTEKQLINLDLVFVLNNIPNFDLIIPNKIQTLSLFLNIINSTFNIKISASVTTLSVKFPLRLLTEFKLDGIIPETIKNLTLFIYKHPLSNVIPKQIETLTLINCNCITFNSDDYKELKMLSVTLTAPKKDELKIPPSVTTLIFKFYCPIKLSEIPSHIQTLHIGQYTLEDGEVIKFPNIKTLTLGDYIDLPLQGSIPESVTELNLGSCNNLVLTEGIIPNSVKKLTFGVDFKQKLTPGMIPESVTELKLPHDYEHDLTEISKRESIKINQDYRSYICDLEFPDNVKEDILRGLNKPIC